MNKKNGLFAFCCACVPGCGQMYLGYMKRGLSILLIFMGIIMISSTMYITPLMMLLPVVWAYAFFDTYALRNQTAAQYESNPDAWFVMPNQGGFLETFSHNHNLIGWGCIVVGVLMLYRTFLSRILYPIANYINAGWIYDIADTLPQLLVIALVLWLGFYLVRGPKNGTQTPAEDYQAYRAPQTYATPHANVSNADIAPLVMAEIVSDEKENEDE